MPSPSFTFRAHVLSALDEKRVCVRVDKEDVDAVLARLNSCDGTIAYKDTIVLNVANCAWNVNLVDWSVPSDLVGVEVTVRANARRYNFWRATEFFDDDNRSHTRTIKYKGVSVIAKEIKA